jgi:thiazole synthase
VQLLCRWDPIGSGQGLNNLRNIQIIIENANVPVIVDAELEHLAKQRMLELGADGVLLNTVAQSRIQHGFCHEIRCSSRAFGLFSRTNGEKYYASASSPLEQISKLF